MFRDEGQVRLVCAGRGLGKSVLLLTSAIAFCLSYNEPINPISPQVAMIIMPTMRQCISIHWLPLLNLLENSAAVENIDKSRYRVTFKGNRPDLILRGADRDGDRLRGQNLCWAGLDEYQDFSSENVFNKILMPALSRNKDWKCLCIFTPKGRSNHAYTFHLRALKTHNWSYFHFETKDNPFISRRALRLAKASLPPKVYSQEYEGNFESFEGQVFSELAEHHKLEFAPTDIVLSFLGVDWGDVCPNITVVGITRAREYVVLDDWGNEHGSPVPEAQLLRDAELLCRKHNVSRCYLPDDRSASILSFRNHGYKVGLKSMVKSVQVVRSQPGPFERSIIANSLFYQNRLSFAPKVHHLFPIFESYHFAKDAQGDSLAKPADGQDDHAIDSTLYVIGQLEKQMLKIKVAKNPTPTSLSQTRANIGLSR